MKNLLRISLFFLFVWLFAACTTEDGFLTIDKSDSDRIGEYTYLSDGGSITGSGQDSSSQIQPGIITAGEWNDLDNWEFWMGLMQEQDWYEKAEYWGMVPTSRYEVILTDLDGEPVIDAAVSLHDMQEQLIWEARTDNNGTAELWSKLFHNNNLPDFISVEYQGNNYHIEDIQAYSSGPIEYELPLHRIVDDRVDIHFVVDATGSMGDELEYLKVELQDVISTVASQNQELDLRLGAVFYRDEGDDYLTRFFRLSENTNEIISAVRKQFASGGGDYPEAVHTALEAAIIQESWSEEARARILFLILDAPPHYEAGVLAKIEESITMAAKKGIRIIPVTASGIDKPTEFLMRFFAIITNGTYTFITDHSGIGNDHLTPTIGQYEVEHLNELMIRLINEFSFASDNVLGSAL